jgi:hypothetical protein
MATLAEIVHDVLVELDQAAEVIVSELETGHSQTDQTISAEAGMALLDGTHPALMALATILDTIQPDHVLKAIIGDYERAAREVAALQPYYDKIWRTRPDLWASNSASLKTAP